MELIGGVWRPGLLWRSGLQMELGKAMEGVVQGRAARGTLASFDATFDSALCGVVEPRL